jgi:DNA polymerase-3 subunit delta'
MPFRDIHGHRRTTALLARAISLGTLPPSLLFGGPDGIGKRRTAVALAQALNCTAPRRAGGEPAGSRALAIDACGECAACRRIARGMHPDVHLIAPDGDTRFIKIDVIRDLNERVGYRPFEGRRRVVIVDDADALVMPAQNALLKTLEEPPSASIFVLVTAQPDLLLPTVRSRCSHVRFAPLAPDEVAAHLEQAEGLGADEAHALAAMADGSIGVALASRSDVVIAVRDGARRMLEQVAGRRDARSRLGAAQAIVGKTPKGYGAGERESVTLHLRVLNTLLRDLGVLSTSAEGCALANADLKPTLMGLLPSFDRPRLVHAFTAVHRALEALGRNASPKIVADWVALQI